MKVVDASSTLDKTQKMFINNFLIHSHDLLYSVSLGLDDVTVQSQNWIYNEPLCNSEPDFPSVCPQTTCVKSNVVKIGEYNLGQVCSEEHGTGEGGFCLYLATPKNCL